ncbi:MAG: PKD domain-containing protein [Gemmatimonadetes bacterium]|nr:PKD domain-containing protein [Gemmatimonadota bacterium]
MVLFRWFIGLLALCLWAPTAQAVQISLPNVEAARGEIVRVPVSVSRFEAGDEVLSSSMDVRFDASVVAIKDISVNRSGSLAESWIVAVNARTVPGGGENDGQLLIGAATANAKISGEGVFFFLELQVSANAVIGTTSPLEIEKVQLNNGTPIAIIVNGSITVVEDRIKAEFVGIPLSGIAPLEVNFEDLSSGDITTYAWDFGDGQTSIDQHPLHVYQDPGSYAVSLTISNAGSSNTETKENYILVEADQRSPEIIEGPIAQGTTHNSTNIYWRTNEEGNSEVEYCGITVRPNLANERELIELIKAELIALGEMTGEAIPPDPDDTDGLIGGHIDIDTASDIAPINDGDTDGHVHAYDNKYDVLVVDYFDLMDSKLHNITTDVSSGEKFKLLIANASLSPGATLQVNNGSDSSGIYSLDGVDGSTQLTALSYHFEANGIATGRVHPTNTGDVRKNVPGPNGEWRNGALTLQAVKVNADGTDGYTLNDQGVAASGLLWETTAFWHWNGPSYHEDNWATHDPHVGSNSHNNGHDHDDGDHGHDHDDDDDDDGDDDDDDGDDDEDENDALIRSWLLRGELPHFADPTHYPLIISCDSKVVDDLVIEHRVPLSDLALFTFYIYRVRSTDGQGNESAWKGNFFVTSSRPDSDPPVIISGPTAFPAVDKALVTWETNELGDGQVQYSLNDDFSDGTRVTNDALVFRHGVWLEGLDPSTTYYYRVRSSDASGNASALRIGHFRTLSSDNQPPVIINGPKVTLRTPFKARVEWKTSKPSTSRVNFGTNDNYGRFAASDDLVQDHQILLTHLDAQTLYHFQVVSTDVSGNTIESGDHTFVTRGQQDIRPPGIVTRPWVVARGTDRCTLGWEIDEPANGWLEYGLSADYGHRVEIPAFDREFRITATGLVPGKNYHGRFHMVDLEGNGPTRSRNFTFFTASQRDRSAPVIEGGPSVVHRSDRSVVVGWTTDEASDSRVEFGENGQFDRSAGDVELTRQHTIIITDLEPGTSYQGRVFSTDAFGNGPVESEVITFTTRLLADTDAPIIYAGPAVAAYSDDSAVIMCQINELAEITVEYGTDTNYGQEVISDHLATTHLVTLPNLMADTEYHVQVAALDVAGNGPTRSRDLTFRTRKTAKNKKPKIRQVHVRKTTDTAALIEWNTSEPTSSVVDYGTSKSYGARIEDPTFTREHQTRISGLQPDTKYYFRVTSQSLAGIEGKSKDLKFKTDADPDLTPPVIVRRPELVVSHSTATIRWRTDEPCFPQVRIGTATTLGTPAEYFFESLVASEDHNITLTGLERGTEYFFVLTSRDLSGNETVVGNNGAGKIVAPLVQNGEISFFTDTESDFTAPAIVDGPHLISRSASEVLVSWTTDEIGDSQLFLERDGRFELVASFLKHDFEHQVLLDDLEAGSTYRIQVASTDPVGNGPGLSPFFSFTTSASSDIAIPKMIVEPEVLALSDRVVTITWVTDEASSAEIFYGQNDLNRSAMGLDLATEHRVELTNLEPNTSYQFEVHSYDVAENGPAVSSLRRFTTAANPDVQAPVFLAQPQIESLSDQTAVIVWSTDEAADAFVYYGIGGVMDHAVGRVALGSSHRVTLANLEPNTTYEFKAVSVDIGGNGPSESAVMVLTTLAESDVAVPSAPTGLSAENTGAGWVALRWQAVPESDVAGYNIFRALGSGPFGLIAGPIKSAFYSDNSLLLSEEYRYQISAVDRVGNESPPSSVIALAVELRGQGDFQGDGLVGLDDFFMMAERFGSVQGEAGYDVEFDFNGDGEINFADFFTFVDLFGSSYRASRYSVSTPDGVAPFDAKLYLQSGNAGRYHVDIRGAGLDGYQGYGLRLHYEEQALRFVGAEGSDGELFAVLEDEPGFLTLGGYRTDGSTLLGEQMLARIFFEAIPSGSPAVLRLDEVIATRNGEMATGRSEGIQLRLVPTDYALLANFPNPFNPQTEIRFQLPTSGPVSLRLYNVLGQQIAVLSDGFKTAGFHYLRWDGRDAAGRPAASGPYFYVLQTAHFRQVRKLMLLR